MKTQKEIREALSKLAPAAKPSEDFIARSLEQQPLRLQNNNATFQCPPQEPAHKAPRLEKENFLLYSNGSSAVRSFNEDAKSKPDFSLKLLDILANLKRENQLNDVKSTGVIDSERTENNLGEDAMQQYAQYNVFGSSELQREPTVETERQSRIMDETSSKGTQLVAPKDEISSCAMLDSSREDILDSPLVALEESDFSSESSNDSDDDNYNEVESMQAIHKLENGSLQHTNGLFGGKGRILPDSSPVLGWSHVFPRNLSRSTGSRSSPSKSSIPGLRSKYSKPDPKANRQSRLIKKPLQLLPNFKVETELEGEDEEDDATLEFFQKEHKQPETELEECISFDWWDSDEEDDPKSRLLSGANLGSKVERRPSELVGNSKVDTEAHNLSQLKGETEDPSSFRSSESFCKQTETKPEECSSFEWSDSDEEDNPKIGENSMSESSDSDAESNSRAEEKSFFIWKDEDPGDDVGMKHGLLSATSQQPVLYEIEGQPTWPNKGVATSPSSDQPIWPNKGVATSNLGPSSDQALPYYNREDYQNSGSNIYSERKSFLGSNQKTNHDDLHRLPASVKFVEAPLWKSPIFPDFPFEINYSYSETPKAPILGFRDHFSPFLPKTMERPWTGGVHKRPHLQTVESFNPALERKKAFELTFNRKSPASKRVKTREEILGEPLTKDEIISLVQNCHEEHRQVNLGRDGLTHNMLHLIHTHWKKRPVCKIKCRGVPTLDMDNVCFHVEDKTGGQIIYRCGGIVYVFRGRNYIYQDRPVIPFMVYRPSSPVYPKLVPQAPAGLTIEEARQLRILGQKAKPLLKLRKNTVLLDLLGDVRDAFQVDDLVSLDYEGVKPSDYRQIGAKLMELVPCVLLSFRNHRIVLWKGRDLKPLPIHSPETCADCGAEPSLEATDVESSCASASETKYNGSGKGFSFSEPDVLPVQPVDDSMLPVIKEESTQHHHSKEDSVCESNLMDSSEVAENNNSAFGTANCSDDDLTIPVGSCRWDQLDGGHGSSFSPSRVDDLWEVALKYGLAVELEGIDFEADLILHKVTVFSEVAPAGPVYTDKLVNRLRLRGVYRKTHKRFVVPLHIIRRKNRPVKNKVAKRASHSPKIEMPPRMGLQADDLIKKLRCTYM